MAICNYTILIIATKEKFIKNNQRSAYWKRQTNLYMFKFLSSEIPSLFKRLNTYLEVMKQQTILHQGNAS